MNKTALQARVNESTKSPKGYCTEYLNTVKIYDSNIQ